MDASIRRKVILDILREAGNPVSASSLARRLEVSRQVIVGDIALLRAQGNGIIATTRGYTMSAPVSLGRYTGKIACQHTLDDTEKELHTIIELGGETLDVIVEHYLYGEITGQLNIATHRDVDDFIQKLAGNQSRLLSELTGGIHLHTVACRDADVFQSIVAELDRLELLYPDV